MSEAISTGQKAVIVFFGVCCLVAFTNVVRFVLSGTKIGILFGLAQCISVLFSAAAGWYLYKSAKAGWYLAFVVVLNYFSSFANLKLTWNIFTITFSAGMLAVLVWLLRPKVKARFGVKLGFS